MRQYSPPLLVPLVHRFFGPWVCRVSVRRRSVVSAAAAVVSAIGQDHLNHHLKWLAAIQHSNVLPIQDSFGRWYNSGTKNNIFLLVKSQYCLRIE